MKSFDDRLNEVSHQLARLDDKSTAHVRAVGKAGIALIVICAALFAASVYAIYHARTNAGQGIAWFASAVTGLFLLASVSSAAGVVVELVRRRRR